MVCLPNYDIGSQTLTIADSKSMDGGAFIDRGEVDEDAYW